MDIVIPDKPDVLGSPVAPMLTSLSSEPAHASSVRRRPRASSYHFLRSREAGATETIPPPLLTWIENVTLRRLDAGRYVELDQPAALVRSTISIAFSHDGKYFASTHGDHTVKVFEYPSGRQIACLDGHPRTPWTVRFHPRDARILASGCLGSDCRVWDVSKRVCIRRHNFRASISCVSFSPDGDLLAVTSGRQLLLWDYMADNRDGVRPSHNWDNTTNNSANAAAPGLGQPRELLEGLNPFHMVDFHPSGTMLMIGEKNRYQPAALATGPNNSAAASAAASADEQQFTLRLVVHRFDRRMDRKFTEPVLEVPRAVAYNDAGIHFSPCGTMLAACIPAATVPNSFRIAVLSLIPSLDVPVGTVLHETPLDRDHVTALTNLKFSATSQHLLAGFSFRPTNPVLRGHAEHYDAAVGGRSEQFGGGVGISAPLRPPQVRVVDIYRVRPRFQLIRSLCADMDVADGHGGGAEDEINVAVFAPSAGVADGVVYGTQKGRIRMFQQTTGPTEKLFSTLKLSYGEGLATDDINFNAVDDINFNAVDDVFGDRENMDRVRRDGAANGDGDDMMRDADPRRNLLEDTVAPVSAWLGALAPASRRISSNRSRGYLARARASLTRARASPRIEGDSPGIGGSTREGPSRYNSV